MNPGFADRLSELIEKRNSSVVVGLDPDIDLLPHYLTDRLANISGADWFPAAANLVFDFGRQIVDAIFDVVPALKPQVAFYEALGPPGLIALQRTIDYARQKGLIVICDAKRNDIESTAVAYAESYLGPIGPHASRDCPFNVDALTVNPYLGSDGVLPFVQAAAATGKGIFVVVRTSNPSAAEFQDLPVLSNTGNTEPLCHIVAKKVQEWGAALTEGSRYSAVGAVVGATAPREAVALRRLMPSAFLLVPGVGAQGGDTNQLSVFFDERGSGALVSASRSLIFECGDHPLSNVERIVDLRIEQDWHGRHLRNAANDRWSFP